MSKHKGKRRRQYESLRQRVGRYHYVRGGGRQALGTLKQVGDLDLFYIEQDKTKRIQAHFSSTQVTDIKVGNVINVTYLEED